MQLICDLYQWFLDKLLMSAQLSPNVVHTSYKCVYDNINSTVVPETYRCQFHLITKDAASISNFSFYESVCLWKILVSCQLQCLLKTDKRFSFFRQKWIHIYPGASLLNQVKVSAQLFIQLASPEKWHN